MKKIKKARKAIRVWIAKLEQIGFDKKDWIAILFDIIYCKLKYRVTANEYFMYRYYNYKDRYRKNFLVEHHVRSKFWKLNGHKTAVSKYRFYRMIPEHFSREMILAPACGEEAFVAFAKKHGKLALKPDTGTYGYGFRIYQYTDDEQARKVFSSLNVETACEEFICQHEKMSALNPDSVNTIRILSLLTDDQVSVISATLRTGAVSGVNVDNLRQNGIGAQVDIATGTVSTHGYDFKDHMYTNHPITGTQFLGFQIPHWDQAIALIREAHKKLPLCRLLGWDIAITPTGVDIVEANDAPGTKITQFGDAIPKGEEVLRAVRAVEKKK